MMKDQYTEIREAIQAADNTLMHLEQAKACLSSAGNWGIVDMLGGGFFSTLMKRNKMHNAEQELTEARDAMRSFAKELRDVNDTVDIQFTVDDFLGFADYFFDGLIVDWMMQSRIDKAKTQVSNAITKVRRIRTNLQGMV